MQIFVFWICLVLILFYFFLQFINHIKQHVKLWFDMTFSPDFLRKQIVTKLLDQSCKDVRKTQSDGWSSEEDDDVFNATSREVSFPQTGDHSNLSSQLLLSNIFTKMLCSSGPPLVSEEELASLALITPARTSQYSGFRVKALIQILQHQLDQQELIKEFMVSVLRLQLIQMHIN